MVRVLTASHVSAAGLYDLETEVAQHGAGIVGSAACLRSSHRVPMNVVSDLDLRADDAPRLKSRSK